MLNCMNVSFLLHFVWNISLGSTNGTVVRVLVSHQCGLGLHPGPVVISGLSCWFWPWPVGIFFWVLQFPSSTKTYTYNWISKLWTKSLSERCVTVNCSLLILLYQSSLLVTLTLNNLCNMHMYLKWHGSWLVTLCL